MAMAVDTKDAVLFVIKDTEWISWPHRDFEQWPILEEVEMNGQKWERWAQLYYVEGQKYSIGQRFESRAAQGEYLFSYGPGVSKTTHCEIICEGGSFWIVDLKGGGTFLNGSRLDNLDNKTELRFGDIISLGGVTSVGAENNEGEEDNSTHFLIKAAGEGCDQEDVLISQGGEAQNESLFPVHNSLIFSKILSYLPLSDIKNCRLVSSEWTEEATKVLLKTSLARLNFSEGYHTPFARTRLFAYIQEMGKIVSQGRFHLKLPNCMCDGFFLKREFHSCGTEFPQAGTPPHKFWFDLEWFFGGGFPHPVTMLKLNGSLRCKQGVTLYKSVLDRVKQTLEDLDLIVDFAGKCLDLEHLVEKPVPFSVLKTLGITLQYTYIYSREEWIDEEDYYNLEPDYSSKMKNWVTSMMQSAPSIQTLKLRTLTGMAVEFPDLVLKSIIANEGFTNLNSLELRSYNFETLELLLKLPQTLQSLTLEQDMPDVKPCPEDYCDSDDDIEEEDGDDIEEEDGNDIENDFDDSEDDEDDDGDDDLNWNTLLEKVLNKMAAELKYLCIYVPDWRVRNPKAIQMPAFPNLKVFKLNGFRKNCITFSDFGLDYDKHFPLLEHLAVQSWTTGKEFFEIFHPIDTDYQCKTVRILDLNVANRKCRLSCPSLTSLSRLVKLFPNVINPQLENVRELPPYDLEASSEERIC